MILLRNGTFVCWLLLVFFCSGPLHARSPRCSSPPFFFGVALDGYPISRERLGEITAEIGISPHIVVFFLQWPPRGDRNPDAFPVDTLNAIWDRGAVPCLTWEPMYHREGREVMIPYRDILNGVYDSYLLDFARQAASWSRPFMIRFAHEMNLSRYHWGTDSSEYGPESPRIYRKMVQHVVTLFQKAGVRNVAWVFCPNAESVPDASYDPTATWNRIENYYPGDAYVDVLGMDGYNWGTTQKRAVHGWDSRWREFPALFRPAWETIRRLAPDKPVLVFETASVEEGGDRHRWIEQALETAREWGLTGMVWFQVQKEADWRFPKGEVDRLRGLLSGTTGCSPQEWIGGVIK